jgi:predicted DNA-binding transcriptional regulator AlpA
MAATNEGAAFMAIEDPYVTWDQLPASIRGSRRGMQLRIDRGEFPPPRQITANRIAWLRSEIEAYMATRPVKLPGEGRRHTEATRARMSEAWQRSREKRAATIRARQEMLAGEPPPDAA